ncbi:response regulator receiver modulated diguanylate cyclase [Solidesulfovibrio fructosivorans JJ]]|uniref:diguanylate cyclase n=1 Tax=Solidesulfovibrio fructosivorans JJ] TaxID=596151 RepID=E1JTM3_SOLFR|nr:diguanylate cyclase [Solidesulfovibrio fructosivorans]EFL52152.1 response regulator receiver modulated diguanylate cyclase [Solidesulfovibrio fructosivorans JJ]]
MLPPKKILIVDDMRANTRLLAKKLSGEYECLTATSGMEALEVVHAQQPDLILLDILMPGMDGFETCRQLKDDERSRKIPVIFITSLDEDEDEAKGLDLGAVDYIRKPFRMPIVKARIRNHIELKRARDLLEEQAFIDSLTAIPNRRRFDAVLDKEWRRAQRNGAPLSLILLDIDFFKKYNDNYGHQQGDDCLRRVGWSLKESVRRAADFVARYGGEEFAVILPGTDTQGALDASDTIRLRISSLAIPHEHSSVAPHVTVSLGVATSYPERNHGPGEIIDAADQALYRAKEEGRNTVKTAG